MSDARAVGIDYDHTLVEGEVWLPNALYALKYFRRMEIPTFVYSCKANYTAGREEISRQLERNGFGNLKIYPKPEAMLYIDDRNHEFTNWRVAIEAVKEKARPIPRYRPGRNRDPTPRS